MYILVFAVFLVYLVAALVLAALHETMIRRQIVSRVQAAGGELLQVKRLRAQVRVAQARASARQPAKEQPRPYYMVRYRTSVGHELTRMCTVSAFGGLSWYDEE
jgi:hypothetical protein